MLKFSWDRGATTVASLVLGLALLGLGTRSLRLTTPSPSPPLHANHLSWTSSSGLALTPDGQRLLVVNPDSHTVSLLDTADLALLAEIGVGIDPRAVAVSPAGDRAFVVNQGSDDLTVVDVEAAANVGHYPLGDRPVGVALSPDGRFLAVAELGVDRIRFLDAERLTTISSLPVADRPHGLAFTPDGRRLVVTHLLSGQVTVALVQPYRSYLSLIGWRAGPGASELVHRIGANQQPVLAGPDPVLTVPTWPNVAPAPAVAINSAGNRAYLPQTMANGLGLNTQFDTSVFPKVSVVNLETDQHQSSEHISLPETDQPVGLPWDAALAREDSELWVVNAASNDVSVVNISDPTTPGRLAHMTVGDNPRAIVFSPDGSTAYVNNTLAGTVSVIDAAAYTVTQVVTVTEIPTAPLLLHGKRLFHSSARPDLAQARWISCNTCHVEGEHDGRTWVLNYLGEVPPGATSVITRNTTALLGMIETYPLRWSAEWDESADSEFSVRFEQYGTGLIHGGEMNPPLGPPNQGRSYDLDALAAFIDSLVAPTRSHELTPAEQRGKLIFESPATGCAVCHPPPLYTDLQVHDVGTADGAGEYLGPYIDTPTLRFLYDSAPYLHDGSALTLQEVLTVANPYDEHGTTAHLTAAEQADLVAFLLALPHAE